MAWCGGRPGKTSKSWAGSCAGISVSSAFCWGTNRGCADGDRMHLSPRELDKLTLHQAGFLAQKRLARGLRLNHPEAVALIATVLLEFIRDGHRVAALMVMGRKLLGVRQVMPGVPEMIYQV